MGQESGRTPIAIKVYIVLQRFNLPKGDELNCRIIAARLTRKAAEEIRDANPGTWVEKHVAVKHNDHIIGSNQTEGAANGHQGTERR